MNQYIIRDLYHYQGSEIDNFSIQTYYRLPLSPVRSMYHISLLLKPNFQPQKELNLYDYICRGIYLRQHIRKLAPNDDRIPRPYDAVAKYLYLGNCHHWIQYFLGISLDPQKPTFLEDLIITAHNFYQATKQKLKAPNNPSKLGNVNRFEWRQMMIRQTAHEIYQRTGRDDPVLNWLEAEKICQKHKYY